MRPGGGFWLIALYVSLVGGAPLYADITPVNFPTPLAQGTSVTGPITNIDPVNQMIQIRDAAGMVQTFRMDGYTEIIRNGSVTSLNGLDIGDIVTVAHK